MKAIKNKTILFLLIAIVVFLGGVFKWLTKSNQKETSLAIPKQLEESGIWQGSGANFWSGTSDHCACTRRERRPKICCQADVAKNRFFKLFRYKQHAYFIPLKIHGFDSAHIPYLDMKIENKIIPVRMDLGFEGAVSFPADIMKELHSKTFLGRHPAYALSGKTYMSDVYRVEEVAIENMTFFPVPIEETNAELDLDIQLKEKEKKRNQGTIGWRLFHKFNLLIDCKHSEIALCDSLETLKTRGYPVHSFVDVPLLLDRGFIEFEAKTEQGILRCLLDSGSTFNMLNKDLDNSDNDFHLFTPKNTGQYTVLNPENDNLLLTFDLKNVCEFSVFNMGEKEFGPMTFNRIKSPLAIEAIMGMEFFEDTLIFIDFDKRKIYFFEYPIENVNLG